MRGEHSAERKGKDPFEGSSPHARGARAIRAASDEVGRIIPACAGNTLTK